MNNRNNLQVIKLLKSLEELSGLYLNISFYISVC